MQKPFAILLLGLLLSFILVSCETTSYYGQAVAGQFYILSHRENINKVLEDESTSPVLRIKLQTILSIRTFAEQELQLPLNNNYSTYVDVQRPYVIWNVFAAPEFSMEPVNWCYPIAGCVSYRGYFSEQKAQDYANKLRQEKHLETYVGGVAAYSTLGWFSDSILNTILNRKDHQLASLIFHELAHQLVYIPGDTEFNESFATAVEQEGLKRWLEYTRTHSEQDELMVDEIINAAEADRQRQAEFVALVSETVAALRELYASDRDSTAMRSAKQTLISGLAKGYQKLKASWGGIDSYDAWFSRELNNAQLNTVATYFDWVPAFEVLLEEAGNDLSTFYAKVSSFEDLNDGERRAILASKLAKAE